MRARVGRPPKDPGDGFSTVTFRLSGVDKRLLMGMADAYGMTITEYLLTLVYRDADGRSGVE